MMFCVFPTIKLTIELVNEIRAYYVKVHVCIDYK